MDELIESFHNELQYFTFPDIDYKIDSSEFNVVDGEEGDYGIIKYMSPNGDTLLAVKTVYGGDNEDIQFTAAGKEYLSEIYLENIKLRIKCIKELEN